MFIYLKVMLVLMFDILQFYWYSNFYNTRAVPTAIK